jgi:hypothetical protein
VAVVVLHGTTRLVQVAVVALADIWRRQPYWVLEVIQ